MNEAAPARLIAQMEALSDPTRLRLLALIERQELGVTELTDVLQLPQSTVSRHLKLLVDQGWVTGRARGTSNFYAMRNDELGPAARRLWQLVRGQTEGWATARQDALRLKSRLAERPSPSQAFFAQSAERWDKLRQDLYGVGFSDAALLALLPRDWVVADLACGTGLMMARLAPHLARVIGIDNSAAMLRAARRRLTDFDNVELRQGDLESLPLEGETCDAALLALALSYVEDPAAVLGETARVLRPRGRLVVVDLLHHDRDDFRREMGQTRAGFEPRELEELIGAAGFGVVRAVPLPPEPQAKGPALMLASADRGPSVTDKTAFSRSARAGRRGRRR